MYTCKSEIFGTYLFFNYTITLTIVHSLQAYKNSMVIEYQKSVLENLNNHKSNLKVTS